MFLDTATIYCKAGNGGDGIVNFHREKYVQYGGPDGGDGGNGGNIYFIGDPSMDTLSFFKHGPHFQASDGEKGEKRNKTGKSGNSVTIKVPCGTVIKDAESNGILADIFEPGTPILVFRGGKGGAGNARFATPTRRSPGFSELGESVEQHKVKLELKIIADIGLVGFPNAGKSTLLSVISAARPKIADYHFTTLTPNLGVVNIDNTAFVVADIPGLIEGASAGAGLGYMFLRHIERVRLIAHVIDISGSEDRDPVDDYNIIRKELRQYSEKLANLPEIVVANKIDIGFDSSAIKKLKEISNTDVIEISASTTSGITNLKRVMALKLKDLPAVKPLEFVPFEYEKKDKTEFNITIEQSNVFRVSGAMIEEYARRVVLSDYESFRWFQKALRERGVIEKLKEAGLVTGGTVRIQDIEFEYTE
ncbi:MAG: GTPase ObgE [Christensenellaceae bacterium]|jgi:GTP-binding protein|nr:GTPase ObgE [Christensenellaceae bacterium]